MTPRKRVLIVDDDPSVLKLLRINFTIEGYDVIEAVDGVEALEKIASEKVDAVVSDIMMPRMDGLALLAKILENPETSSIPVILCSAKAQGTDVDAGITAGAVAYITKPFDPADLIAAVEEHT